MIQRLDIKVGPKAGSDQDTRPLQGLTFAVKDMFAVAGETAGFGCPDWKSSHQPSASHAPCLTDLLGAGAHLVANTVCDELAFSLDGVNIHYGTPLNPRAPERIPGGSSSGAASVVAQGVVDFALGTDTAGSIRVPASYCGIWGLRPTHGSISCRSVLPLGPTFDTVGILASRLDVLKSAVSVLIQERGTARATRLLIASECFALLDSALLPPAVASLHKLRTLFQAVEERVVVEDGLAALSDNFATIRSWEVWQCHGDWFESTAPYLSPDIEARLKGCRGTDEKKVEKSRLYRQTLQAKFRHLLDGTVLCLPTTPGAPPLKTVSLEAFTANRSLNLKLNSIASFLGLPQITIPIGLAPGQPCAPGLTPGLSLIGGEGAESELLRLAAELTN